MAKWSCTSQSETTEETKGQLKCEMYVESLRTRLAETSLNTAPVLHYVPFTATPHRFRVLSSILSVGYYLCGVSVHVNQHDQCEAGTND